jgi:ABC-type polysaccharide/polyol phosphate transport system ATPase subunit
MLVLYTKTAKKILYNINMKIKRGGKLVIVGHNGAGNLR